MEVQIYLEVSSRAPRLKDGSYRYALTCAGAKITGSGTVDGTTSSNRLMLTCAAAALHRMRKASVITIHTDSRYLANNHQHMHTWAANDWKRTDGKPVKNADLWKTLKEAEAGHAVRYVTGPIPEGIVNE